MITIYLADILDNDSHAPYSTDICPRPPKYPLDHALELVISALACLHRAGPYYIRRSKPLKYFCYGSWTRDRLHSQLETAIMDLPKRNSVEDDVRTAERVIVKAIAVLRKLDRRDAKELKETMEACLGGEQG